MLYQWRQNLGQLGWTEFAGSAGSMGELRQSDLGHAIHLL